MGLNKHKYQNYQGSYISSLFQAEGRTEWTCWPGIDLHLTRRESR